MTGLRVSLIDVGAGMGAAQVVENIRRAGFDPASVRHILCTHAHGDHAGGAARMRALLPNASVAMSGEAAGVHPQRRRDRDEHRQVAKTAGTYPVDYKLGPVRQSNGTSPRETGSRSATSSSSASTRAGTPEANLSFLLEHGAQRSLFAGDVAFHGGRSSCRTPTTAGWRR